MIAELSEHRDKSLQGIGVDIASVEYTPAKV